VSAQWSGL